MSYVLSKLMPKDFSLNFRILKSNMKVFAPYYNLDSDEEIVENILGSVMLIGINLPQQKNILTESALDKLNRCVQKFNITNDIIVAVLHGCGGNFCTGVETNKNTTLKSKELIKVLHNVKKPIVGSLQGYVKNFGFQLAIMCDLRAMDETALIGFGDKNMRSNVPDEVYARLSSAVGTSKALEMSLTNCSWTANEAQVAGLVNRSVECGSALGQAIVWAQSIAMTSPEIVIKEKSKVYKSFFQCQKTD